MDYDYEIEQVELNQQLGNKVWLDEIIGDDLYLLRRHYYQYAVKPRYQLLDAHSAFLAALNPESKWDTIIYLGSVTRQQSLYELEALWHKHTAITICGKTIKKL